MTKLPEPAIRQERFHYNSYGEITAQLPDLIGYTEAQMLQFRRDALEEAANLIVGTYAGITAAMCSNLVRKLKDET